MNPTKPKIKTEIIPIILILISIAVSFYFYPNLPDKVASHWNFQGEVDSWTSKTFHVIFFPALMVGMYLLFTFLPYIDPRRKRYEEFAKTYNILKNIFMIFMFALYLLTSLYNLGYQINITTWTTLLIGALFIIIGNYMGKIKYNWFMGIKTPWTLSSEKVWNKTHRLSGWLFILLGIIVIATPYLPDQVGLIVFFTSIIVVVAGSFAYSYYLYRIEKK